MGTTASGQNRADPRFTDAQMIQAQRFGARLNSPRRIAGIEASGSGFTTELEAGLCSGAVAVVLGGGNSAEQAALYLARRCRRVIIVIGRASLAETMSQYLVSRIEAHELIDVATDTVIGRRGFLDDPVGASVPEPAAAPPRRRDLIRLGCNAWSAGHAFS